MICPYCEKEAKLVTGKEIYPFLSHLHDRNFYSCINCDAYVGTHKGTTKPMGTLANKELRHYRVLTHKCFDKTWKNGRRNRSQAYRFLAKILGIKISDCHIGLFDVDTCKKVITLCG